MIERFLINSDSGFYRLNCRFVLRLCIFCRIVVTVISTSSSRRASSTDIWKYIWTFTIFQILIIKLICSTRVRFLNISLLIVDSFLDKTSAISLHELLCFIRCSIVFLSSLVIWLYFFIFYPPYEVHVTYIIIKNDGVHLQ